MNILFIAPLPPPISGHSLASKVLLDELERDHVVEAVNLGVASQNDGSVTRRRLVEVGKVLVAVWRKRKRSTAIYLTISESLAGNIKDLLIYALCANKLSDVYIHLHGGSVGIRLFDRYKLLQRLNRLFMRRCGGAIVTSASHVKVFEGMVDRQRIHIVQNFAEDYLFVSEQEIRDKFASGFPFRILFMGSLIEEKGVNELVDGFAALPNNLRKLLRIDLAGKFRSESEKRAFLAKISNCAEAQYHGIVQGDAKHALLKAAHFLCLPTSFVEGQPISILEGYASGCVVLATMRGGIPDVFTPGINGFEIKKRSADEVRSTLETALSNSHSLADMALRNRRTAAKDFRTEIFTSSIRRILESSGTDRQPASAAKTVVGDEGVRYGKSSALRAYQICSNCVMDTTDTNITFDDNGVCDHCTNFYKNTLPRWRTDAVGAAELERITASIKKAGLGKDFDCILGISGGVDSSYLAYVVKARLGLRPLVFHVDAGWNTQEAVNNIERIVDKLHLDLYTHVIDWEEMRDLQLAFFKAGVPHVDVPQDHAFFAAMYNFAAEYGIKYILTGANHSTECIKNPRDWMYFQSDVRQIKDIHRRFGRRPLNLFPLSNILRHKIYLPYIRGIRVVRLLDYVPYVKEEAAQFLVTEFGWQRYPQKHFESRFTRFYEGYWLPKKFGFDTRKVQFSSLILTKQMTRDQALRMLWQPAYDESTIARDIEYVATKLGITVEELQTYMDGPNRTYRDYKSQRNIFAAGAWAMKTIGLETVVKR